MATKITTDVLKDYLNCKYKAHLRLAGQEEVKSDYEAVLTESWQKLRLDVILNILARHPERAVEQGIALSTSVLTRGAPFILDAEWEDDHFVIAFDGLKKVDGGSALGNFHYLPVLFYEGRQVRKAQRLLLEALAVLLSRIQGKAPERGVIYHGADRTATTIRLTPGLSAAEDLLGEVARMRHGGSAPKFLLNAHCQACEFHRRCHAQAVREDSLSLLRGLGEKDVQSYARKGLFTLTQLAHTFRPRRKGKRSERGSKHRYHALQALAIRDKRVYVFGAPEVPSAPVRIYLDLEGVPDGGYVYLVGMIVCDGGGETRYSFWADSEEQECAIFGQFMDVVSRYDKPLIFCYGSYEKAFIKRMRRKEPGDALPGALVNTLSIIYGHFYFPTYSNGLKAVAGHLGFSWSDQDASGLRSVAWRLRWERTRDDAWKRKLLEYNQEDCAALRKVTDFLASAAVRLATHSVPAPPAPAHAGAPAPQVVGVRELDKLAGNGRTWGRVNFAHPDFEFVNNCAYFDYQRQRVFVRASRVIRKHRRRPGLRRNRKIRPSRRVTITASKCPACHGKDLVELPSGERPDVPRPRAKRALDLAVTAGGMRRRVIECRAKAYRCAGCGHAFVPDRHRRLAKHYHGLMSWAMYEHVAHQVSSGALKEKFREFFGVAVANAELHMFKGLMARRYRSSYRGLLAKILAGPVLHVDETEVKLRTGKGYVWVFTSLEEVVFVYKPTREGDFVSETLKDFRGVLVSDFYAAYDSIGCEQQKCLIHLIRDMNQELLNNPFDEELQLVTLPFSALLKSVVATVDERGLRRTHLARHQSEVEEFFRVLLARPLRSESARAVRNRLVKNRDKLFTFIRHDGVPWNNNNAENAIKRFAYYREGTVGTLKEAGLSDYLVLLSLYQTCRYKGVSFLKFLLSKERNIDVFCAKKRMARHPAIELYPKGFTPPLFTKLKAALKAKRAAENTKPDDGACS
jgi:predicted RecB family nuclease